MKSLSTLTTVLIVISLPQTDVSEQVNMRVSTVLFLSDGTNVFTELLFFGQTATGDGFIELSRSRILVLIVSLFEELFQSAVCGELFLVLFVKITNAIIPEIKIPRITEICIECKETKSRNPGFG